MQTFDSCRPWGSAGFVGPLHTLPAPTPHQEASTVQGRPGGRSAVPLRSPTPSLPLNHCAPNVAPARRTFVKVCLPATHSPARTLQSSATGAGFGDRLLPRNKMGCVVMSFKIQAPDRGWGPGRTREEPAGSQAVGRRGSGVRHLPNRPPSRSPSHPLPGAPSTSARLGATGREQLPGGATSALAGSVCSLTAGFYLRPGALSASCAG